MGVPDALAEAWSSTRGREARAVFELLDVWDSETACCFCWRVEYENFSKLEKDVREKVLRYGRIVPCKRGEQLFKRCGGRLDSCM